MPAKSKAQQTAMCMALAARKGELDKKELKGAALNIYNSEMTNKEIEDFTKLKEGMTSLKDFLNESIVNESIDNASAEKICFDILYKNAKSHRVDADEDKLRDFANAVIDYLDGEGELKKHNKNNFEEYLTERDFFNILSVADVLMEIGEMEEKDHDFMYEIFGE